jgi:GLPGLI family protein
MLPRIRTTLLVCSLLSATLAAQVDYGRVTYVRSVSDRTDQPEDHADIPGSIAAQIRQLRQEGGLDGTYTLTFTPRAAIYEEQPAEDITLKQSGGRMVTILRSGKAPERWYTDYRASTYTNSLNIADRQFLVSGKVEPLDWAITERRISPGESTGGFDLRVAEAITAAGDTLLAGFAAAIPQPFGPENYGGLPGAILQLTIYGENKITHYGVTAFAALTEPFAIAIPTDGKRVSREEFDRLQKKVAARTR